MTQLDRFQYPRFARRYVRMSEALDRRGVAELRRKALVGLQGRVVEVGCGNGLNFTHYPTTVTEVVAVEPETTLRRHAQQATRSAPVPISVVAGHADDLPGESESYDAAVVSLVLCSVPDPATALAEIRRVLRPGGTMRFGEHVRAESKVGGAIQDMITPLSARFDAGCRQNRDTASAITAAGFTMSTLERFSFRVYPLLPGQPMIMGTATRPSD